MVRAQLVIAWVVSLFIAVSGVAGCGADRSGGERLTVARSAVFTNGDFEVGVVRAERAPDRTQNPPELARFPE